jgi:putative phosphoesterase
MTKIGLLSDTHGWLDPKIKLHFADVDEIWHAGDIGDKSVLLELEAFKPTRAVYGNIDDFEVRSMAPEHNSFMCEGIKVLITHIAGKPGKYYQQGKAAIEEFRPKLFICGHSHILLVKNDPHYNMLWLNPGACGYKGFHQVRTLLRFDIDGDKIMNMEAIELGDRSVH